MGAYRAKYIVKAEDDRAGTYILQSYTILGRPVYKHQSDYYWLRIAEHGFPAKLFWILTNEDAETMPADDWGGGRNILQSNAPEPPVGIWPGYQGSESSYSDIEVAADNNPTDKKNVKSY